MAKATFQSYWDSAGGVAYFRDWGSKLSAAIQAMGLVKTADTGQINWGTAAAPVTSGYNFTGYEIFRFADALQAAQPVFLKFEYGTGPTNYGPLVRISVGKGSDGAGNLTGLWHQQYYGSNAAYNGDAATPSYVCGDVNRIAFVCGLRGQNYPFFFSLERTKDAAGADTAEGMLLVGGACLFGGVAAAWTNTQTFMFDSLTTGSGRTRFGDTLPGVINDNAAANVAGAFVGLVPIPMQSYRGMENPPLGLLCVEYPDVGGQAGIEFDAQVYGAAHHFITAGAAGYHSTSSPATTGEIGKKTPNVSGTQRGYQDDPNMALALRWE